MLHEIERLSMTQEQKERIQQIYDYYIEQIDKNGGQYKTPTLKVLAPKVFDCSGDTLRKALNKLVDIGLLTKTGTRHAVYGKPDEVIELPHRIAGIAEEATEPVDEELVEEPSEEIAELTDDEVALFIEAKSFMMRGQRVMLDRDVAQVYGVKTERLNQQRQRNPDNFPDDFAYQVTPDETLQIARLRTADETFTHDPWSYTLEGINMGATVLKTPKAIQRSIVMVRTFSDLERMAHGEEPKQPGFAELMQMVVEQNKMLANSITLQGQQLTDGIVKVSTDVDGLKVDVDKYKVETETAKGEAQNMRLALERHERTDKIAVEVDKLVKLGVRIANDGELINYGPTWSRWGQIVQANGSRYINVKTLRYDQVEPAMKATKQLLYEYGQEYPETVEMLKNHHPIRYKWYLDVVQDMNVEDIPF